MHILLLGLVFLFPQEVQELEIRANSAIDQAERKILKIKPDGPDVEKCPCNGKGYIVHGDGHRTPCPGTSAGPCKYQGSFNSLGYDISEIDMGKKTVIINGVMYSLKSIAESVDDIKKQEKPKRRHAEIEICSLTTCAPCQILKQDPKFQAYLDTLRRSGWKVNILELDTLGQRPELPAPYVRVYMQGERNVAPIYNSDGSFNFNNDFLAMLNRRYAP
jgi:hypothetical protein